MTTTAKPKTEELTEFAWDDENSTDSFFGTETVEKSPIEEVKKEIEEEEEDDAQEIEVKAEEVKKETTGKKETKEEEAPEAFFKETEEQQPEEKPSTFFTDLAKDLKEKGLFQFVEIKDDDQIDADKFFEMYDEDTEARVDATIQSFMEELDEDGKNFLKFKKSGGSNADFFATYYQIAQIPEVDIEDATQHDKVLKYYYKEYEELEDADIEDKLEWLAETAKKEKYAKKYYEKIQQDATKAKQKLVDDQKADQKVRETKRKEFVDSVKDVAGSVEELNGFKFTKKDKTELVDFITKPSVAIAPNKYITGIQDSINKLFKGDKEKLLLLAKLLKNDFDFSEFVSKAKTEVTKQTRTRIETGRNTARPSSSGVSTKRGLADYF